VFPRSAHSYRRAGIPLRQVHWRPYPLHLGHFPQGASPRDAAVIFAGGAHQRDWPTLARALVHLGREGCRPILLHTPGKAPPPLLSAGEVHILRFYESMLRSRFVVLPLTLDLRRPAGISVVSMALAAGRPIVASATSATVAHLRHGHNALLVPPGNPKALAAAMKRLDEDDALLDTLAANARASAQRLSVAAWADELIAGATPRTVFPDGPNGPYHPWPT
jgi:glycosyltransferase involved in cell wall biosynthesis